MNAHIDYEDAPAGFSATNVVVGKSALTRVSAKRTYTHLAAAIYRPSGENCISQTAESGYGFNGGFCTWTAWRRQPHLICWKRLYMMMLSLCHDRSWTARLTESCPCVWTKA